MGSWKQEQECFPIFNCRRNFLDCKRNHTTRLGTSLHLRGILANGFKGVHQVGIRIYCAAPWKTKDRMPAIAGLLEANGHTLTHKWWEAEDTPESDRTAEILRAQAKSDVQGVLDAQVVVVINSAKSEGKATEQGIAIAHRKPIICIGKRGEHSANVFQYLPNYRWVDTIEEAVDILNTLTWLLEAE